MLQYSIERNNGFETEILIKWNLKPHHEKELFEILNTEIGCSTQKIHFILASSISLTSNVILQLNKIEEKNSNRIRLSVGDEKLKRLLKTLNDWNYKNVNFRYDQIIHKKYKKTSKISKN